MVSTIVVLAIECVLERVYGISTSGYEARRTISVTETYHMGPQGIQVPMRPIYLVKRDLRRGSHALLPVKDAHAHGRRGRAERHPVSTVC
jgi:hypothetical protein